MASSNFKIIESSFSPQQAILREVVDSGDYFITLIKAGQTARIVDLEGNQAVDTLFYSSDDPSERYSASDTIREQRSLYLTTGSCLTSNANRPMLQIVADTCGRHDTLGGACSS